MRQANKRIPESGEKTVRDIRRATRRHHSAEEKIRIVLEGLRGEDSIAELCRKEGINQNLYYRWSKEFLEAHVSVPKTAMQLLGLPKMGVPRLDNDPGLADRVGATVAMAAPPGFGARISLPPPPKQRPPIPPLPGPPGPPRRLGRFGLRGGPPLPPRVDVVPPHKPGPPPSFTPRPGTKPKPPAKPKPKGRGQTPPGVPPN